MIEDEEKEAPKDEPGSPVTSSSEKQPSNVEEEPPNRTSFVRRPRSFTQTLRDA